MNSIVSLPIAAAVSVASPSFAASTAGSERALHARHADPIFAAIERHRRAYRDWMDSYGEDEIEELVPLERRQSSLCSALYGNPDWKVEGDDPRWIAHIENACRTSAEHDEASIALVSNDTITVAGAVALLEYVRDHDAKDLESWPDLEDPETGRLHGWHYFLAANLADAMRNLVTA